MSFKLGIENDENGSKFTLEYLNKNYTHNIAKIIGISGFKEPLRANITFSRSTYFLKYGINFHNLLFFPLLNDIWTTKLEINSKKKLIKFVNYDIIPVIKLVAFHTKSPISLYIKYANYRASAEQQFGDYDYMQILKSLLPYNRIGIGVRYENMIDLKHSAKNPPTEPPLLDELNNAIFYKLKLKYNKIYNYEDSIKIGCSTKYVQDFEILNLLDISVTNETIVNNSFIFNSVSTEKNQSNSTLNTTLFGSYDNNFSDETVLINPHHILSANEVNSRILGINVMGVFKELNIGQKFYASNNVQLKFKNISLIKDLAISSIVEPFVGFETIFVPYYEKFNKKAQPVINFNQSFKFIVSLGFGLKINQNMAIDFTLKTFTKGIHNIDASSLDKFRMNLNLTTNF